MPQQAATGVLFHSPATLSIHLDHRLNPLPCMQVQLSANRPACAQLY